MVAMMQLRFEDVVPVVAPIPSPVGRQAQMSEPDMDQAIHQRREAVADMEVGIKDLRESWGDGSPEVREALTELARMRGLLAEAQQQRRGMPESESEA